MDSLVTVPVVPRHTPGAQAVEWIICDTPTVDNLFAAVRENLNAAVEHATQGRLAASDVALPIKWDIPERGALGKSICRQAAALAQRGSLLDEPMYVTVTGMKGAGKTTIMRALMQGIHLSLYGNSSTPSEHHNSRLVQGLLRRPLFAVPRDPKNPFAEPPLVQATPTPGCMPVPAHLMAMEVLRANKIDVPGVRRTLAGSPGWNSRLCWHQDAYHVEALDTFTRWLLSKKLTVMAFVDELQIVFHSDVDKEFARQWYSQLPGVSYGVSAVGVGYCFSASSTLLSRILSTHDPVDEAALAKLGSVPRERNEIHPHRIKFYHMHPATTLEAFEWLVMNSNWPNTGPALSLAELEALYSTTLGIGRFLTENMSAVANPRKLLADELRSKPTLLGPMYKAMAAALFAAPTTAMWYILSTSLFDPPDVNLSIPLAEVKRRLVMLAELNVDTSAKEISEKFNTAPMKHAMQLWKDSGFVVEKSGDMLAFPSVAHFLAGLVHLADGSTILHPEVVRTVLLPEGTSAGRFGEAIVAAGLCEVRHDRSWSNVADLLNKHLDTEGSGLALGDVIKVKEAITRTQWRWLTEGGALDGLKTGQSLMTLPAKAAVQGLLYKPVPDNIGVDLIGICKVDETTYAVICALAKLSAGASGMPMCAGDIAKIAARIPFLPSWAHAEIAKKKAKRHEAIQKAAKATAAGGRVKGTLQDAAATLSSNGSAHTDNNDASDVGVDTGLGGDMETYTITAETTDEQIERMVSRQRAEIIEAMHMAYKLPDGAKLIPLLLVVSNRVLGPEVNTNDLAKLVPENGGASVLTSDKMAPYWPSPVRVLAHDFLLNAYGAPIDTQELAKLRNSSLSASPGVAKVLARYAVTESERNAAQAEADADAERIRVEKETAHLKLALSVARLEHRAHALARQGVTAFSMKSVGTDNDLKQSLVKAARKAGLNIVEIAMFVKLLS